MKLTKVKFLKNCATVSRQIKEGEELEIDTKSPEFKELVNLNYIKNYFEIINNKKKVKNGKKS